MRAASVFLLASGTHALVPAADRMSTPPTVLRSTHTFEDQPAIDALAKSDLEAFATECNPRIEYFDPLNLADQQFWGSSNAATIAHLRHAEMKHGRIAMLGFIGYVVQANGWHFPWCIEANGFPPNELSPPDQWDVLDPFAKFQLFFFIGLLEIWSEGAPNHTHHMKAGGTPGKFPAWTDKDGYVFASLWDPLRLTRDMTPATKAKKLAKEVNNGRLAMLGLFSFFVESKTPGAVPFLSNVVQPYIGNYMLPFSYWDFLNYFFDESHFDVVNGFASESGVDYTAW